jgi:glycosyltransferase involved in cell wall biosynthesis
MRTIKKLYFVTDVDLNEKTAQPVHILSLTKYLAKLGVEVRLIYPTLQDEFPSIPPEVYPEPVEIPRKLTIGLRLYHLYLLKRLIQLPRPDVIYVRLSGQIIAPALWCSISDTPMFLEVNGAPEKDYYSFTKDRGIIRRLRVQKIKLTEFVNFRTASGIIFVNESLKKYYASKYRIPEEKVIVIRNGADPEVFRPIEKTEIRNKLAFGHNDELLLGFVGSLQPWYGVENAIKAVKILKNRGIKCSLIIVGNGPEKERLESLAHALRPQDNVKFVGEVPWDLVPQYIGAFDICIIPFTRRHFYKDNSPLKLYEYMACAKPIVATNDLGLEIVSKLNVGTNAKDDSPESLADAIIELINRKSEWEEMGKRGREYVEKNASWKTVAETTMEFIQKRLNG